jgi:hypothetical protein
LTSRTFPPSTSTISASRSTCPGWPWRAS